MDHAEPEELSRRISEIDLTNIRRRSDTSDSMLGPRYQTEDLIRLRPIDALALADGNDFYQEGVKTPPQTRAPPSTPAVPASPANAPVKASPTINGGIEAAIPELDENEDATSAQPAANIGLAIEPAKKKKRSKKSSGKDKLPPASGFEGEFLAIFKTLLFLVTF